MGLLWDLYSIKYLETTAVVIWRSINNTEKTENVKIKNAFHKLDIYVFNVRIYINVCLFELIYE